MRLERVPTETGAILYDRQRFAHPRPEFFDPDGVTHAGLAIRAARGRGSAWFLPPIEPGGPELALRHYQRGGFVARFVARRYAWRGEEATRCFRELRLLAHLEALDLPAARPVAALYRRVGVWAYEAALLTVRITGGRPLSGQFAAMDDAAWHHVGATIAAFHAAGVDHADLNAHNILMDPHGHAHLIDFDRGVVRAPGAWAAGNLARLARSLVKTGGPEVHSHQWRALMSGYESPLKAPRR